jgi:hypothetical protein
MPATSSPQTKPIMSAPPFKGEKLTTLKRLLVDYIARIEKIGDQVVALGRVFFNEQHVLTEPRKTALEVELTFRDVYSGPSARTEPALHSSSNTVELTSRQSTIAGLAELEWPSQCRLDLPRCQRFSCTTINRRLQQLDETEGLNSPARWAGMARYIDPATGEAPPCLPRKAGRRHRYDYVIRASSQRCDVPKLSSARSPTSTMFATLAGGGLKHARQAGRTVSRLTAGIRVRTTSCCNVGVVDDIVRHQGRHGDVGVPHGTVLRGVSRLVSLIGRFSRRFPVRHTWKSVSCKWLFGTFAAYCSPCYPGRKTDAQNEKNDCDCRSNRRSDEELQPAIKHPAWHQGSDSARLMVKVHPSWHLRLILSCPPGTCYWEPPVFRWHQLTIAPEELVNTRWQAATTPEEMRHLVLVAKSGRQCTRWGSCLYAESSTENYHRS